MFRKTFIIQVKTKHVADFDPNLPAIINDIKDLYNTRGGYRDRVPFNIEVCIDGYRYDEGINDAFTFFMHVLFNNYENIVVSRPVYEMKKYLKRGGKQINLIKAFIRSIFVKSKKTNALKNNFELFITNPEFNKEESLGIINLSPDDFFNSFYDWHWHECESLLQNKGASIEFNVDDWGLNSKKQNEIYLRLLPKLTNIVAHIRPRYDYEMFEWDFWNEVGNLFYEIQIRSA